MKWTRLNVISYLDLEQIRQYRGDAIPVMSFMDVLQCKCHIVMIDNRAYEVIQQPDPNCPYSSCRSLVSDILDGLKALPRPSDKVPSVKVDMRDNDVNKELKDTQRKFIAAQQIIADHEKTIDDLLTEQTNRCKEMQRWLGLAEDGEMSWGEITLLFHANQFRQDEAKQDFNNMDYQKLYHSLAVEHNARGEELAKLLSCDATSWDNLMSMLQQRILQQVSCEKALKSVSDEKGQRECELMNILGLDTFKSWQHIVSILIARLQTTAVDTVVERQLVWCYVDTDTTTAHLFSNDPKDSFHMYSACDHRSRATPNHSVRLCRNPLHWCSECNSILIESQVKDTVLNNDLGRKPQGNPRYYVYEIDGGPSSYYDVVQKRYLHLDEVLVLAEQITTKIKGILVKDH